MGTTVSVAGRLRGLFGLDFQVRDSDFMVTELNPRYTASTELYEHALGIPLLQWHARACREDVHPESFALPAGLSARCAAKAVVYASRRTIVPPLVEHAVPEFPNAVPELADVPAAGTVVEPGHPMFTVYGFGADARSCLRLLKARLRGVMRRCGISYNS